MNNRKRELIEHLVRSIDYTKERILYWERLRTRESYDIFVRLNESDKENELVKVEYKDEHKQVDPDDFYKEARCKTAGGQMGYSKCYKDGKEI